MRRLAAEHAKAGMVLARPLADAFGNVICEEDEKLPESTISKLATIGIAEIFIDDPVTSDVPVEPLISPEVEAQATQALRTLATESAGGTEIDQTLLQEAIKPAHDMAKSLFPSVLGELNTAPCSEPSEYGYREPARAAGLAAALAAKCGLEIDGVTEVAEATLLMDVGYLCLLPGTISDDSPWTRARQHDFNKHPVHGYAMLKDSPLISSTVATAILQSHERLDGSGYPQGLKGDAIIRAAKFVAVADSYYSMITPRPHHEAWDRHDAVEYMMAYGGELFDPEIIQVFSRSIPVYPTGVLVKLSTGEAGFVVDANIGQIGRPLVRLICNKKGIVLKDQELPELDLVDPENSDRVIVKTLEY